MALSRCSSACSGDSPGADSVVLRLAGQPSVVASSRSSVLAYMRRKASLARLQAGRLTGRRTRPGRPPGLVCGVPTAPMTSAAQPCMPAAPCGRRGGQHQPADDGRPRSARSAARRSCRWRSRAGRPGRTPWRRGTRSRRAPSARWCPGVVPVEPPTPALSKVTTRRPVASASISAGSQLSRFPRKCWSSTSGTAPVPAPFPALAPAAPVSR